jgi:hypothetical protein
MKIKKSLISYWNEWKGTFLTGVICALIVHLYFFTNTLPNYDTLVTQYSYNFGLALGRWTSFFGTILSSPYALPWVTGVLCCAYLGGCCVLVCDVLNLRTKTSRFLACGLITAFPALSSNFSFLFIADSGAMGILLAALSVKLAKDTPWGVLTGGVVLGFATGFYQAHLSFAMVLMALTFGMQLLCGAMDEPKKLFKQAGTYMAAALVGILVYYVGFRLCLLITGYTLPQSYQDIHALLHPSINLLESFRQSWQEIAGNFTTYLPFLQKIRTPLILLSGLCAICGELYLIIKNRIYRKPLPLIALILLLPLTGIALTAPSFISNNVGYHSVMRTAWSLLYCGLVMLSEQIFLSLPTVSCQDAPSLPKRHNKPALVIRACTILVAAVTLWNFWIMSNMGYLSMQQRYEHDYATMVRVMDRLEQRDDYTQDTPVVFLGSTAVYNEYFAHDPSYLYEAGMTGKTMLVYPSVYHDFLRYYLGVEVPYAGDSTAEILRNSPEVKALPSWPDKACIAMVDGVLVVNMG